MEQELFLKYKSNPNIELRNQLRLDPAQQVVHHVGVVLVQQEAFDLAAEGIYRHVLIELSRLNAEVAAAGGADIGAVKRFADEQRRQRCPGRQCIDGRLYSRHDR